MSSPNKESRIINAQNRANSQWEIEIKFYQSELEKLRKKINDRMSDAENKQLYKKIHHASDCLEYCQSKVE
jgi:aspartate/tyrosine/aromatic aminotransferase